MSLRTFLGDDEAHATCEMTPSALRRVLALRTGSYAVVRLAISNATGEEASPTSFIQLKVAFALLLTPIATACTGSRQVHHARGYITAEHPHSSAWPHALRWSGRYRRSVEVAPCAAPRGE